MEARKGLTASELLLTLGFLAFFIPANYALPAIVFKLWEWYYMGVALVAVAVLFFTHFKDINIRYILFVLYFTWVIFGTQQFALTHTMVWQALLKPYLKCIGFISLLEVGFLSCPKKTVVKSFLNVGLLMSFLHFVTFLIYGRMEGGMRHGESYMIGNIHVHNTDQNWYFMTYDNASIFIFLPILALLLYYVWYDNRKAKKSFYCYLIILLVMFVTKMAATALVGTLMFTVVILYYIAKMKRNRKKHKWEITSALNYVTACLAGLAFDLGIVLIVGNPLVEGIANRFGKDASFSGRDYIWAESLKIIKQHWLTGIGMEDTLTTTLRIGQTHCHNILIENLYVSGAISLVMFLLLVWLFRPQAKKSFAAIIFSAAILTYFVISGLDWAQTNPLSMSLFYFSYYLSDEKEDAWVFLTRRLGLLDYINH